MAEKDKSNEDQTGNAPAAPPGDLDTPVALKEEPKATGKPSGVNADAPIGQVIKETKEALHKQKQVEIMIPSGESEESKSDVPVGINGHTYLIKRDNWVKVPESVVRVLENAKFDVYSQVPRGEDQDGYELVGRQVLRFPFQRR